MFYHNLKLAFRNLWRSKTFSFINILGLTIGLACCLIIGLYSFSELSFDRFNQAHSNIYRVNKITNEKDKAQVDGLTPGQLAPALSKNLPEVAQAARFRPWFNDMLVSYNTVHIKLADVVYADASLLTMFNFPLLKGNAQTALKEPFTAVITQSAAKKFFGSKDPVGKTLITLNDMPVTITGVSKDVPYNSSLQFSMLISFATLTAPSNADNFSWMNSWSTQVQYTFVQLKDHTDIIKEGDKISQLMHNNFPEKEFKYRTFLQPLDDIHLHSEHIVYADFFRTNSSTIIYTLVIIAAFILLIASFNFINLSTAGALSRAKETGVQKVLGARQIQLIEKFFSESFLMCLLSFLLAISIVSYIIPFFNSLSMVISMLLILNTIFGDFALL